ncbi:MAG TPA: hypothetical protein VHN59_09280 [Chitinophagaceae bacterium]|nr:hypothetical protein [Chitinophagaceae bacterium]
MCTSETEQAPKPVDFDSDGSNQVVSKLFNASGTDKRVGPGLVLKVMAGDKFKANVFGWYQPGANAGELPGATSIIGEIEIKKNGYLYVYVSNESQGAVYFDDLHVTHIRGPLLEEMHYYPFGLTMAGISSKALEFGNPENKRKFNRGTELNTDFNINLYETAFRGYDPQIGRFHQIDK